MVNPIIQGLREAQTENLKMIRALSPHNQLGKAVQTGLIVLQRYAVGITHVDTSALRASHRMRMEFSSSDAIGEIYIDPSARNPRSGKRTAEYGPYEHARGGDHAFYERTYNEEGDRALALASAVLEAGL